MYFTDELGSGTATKSCDIGKSAQQLECSYLGTMVSKYGR